MGLGDDIMATGMAAGAAARGKRIAFGDRHKIIWGPWSADIFRGNPNIAKPGSEYAEGIEWINYYKGNRLYNRAGHGKWVWNYDFRPTPGEIYFDDRERQFAETIDEGYVLIEPNVPWNKSVAPNKDWGLANYQAVADGLSALGYRVAQFSHGRDRLTGVRVIDAATFRYALAALSRVRLAILPEGGLHHGAAALDVPAVVIFGGFIPPQVTGYPMHINLTGGIEACGSWHVCRHCRNAMDAISVNDVLKATTAFL